MVKKLLLAAALLSLFGSSRAANSFFKKLETRSMPVSGEVVLQPKEYLLFEAKQQSLKTFLKELPSAPDQAVVIELPTPSGTYQKFRVWQTSMMEQPLQTKYSDITTYTAVSLDNPNITAKIDHTLKGFHAMVFAADGTYFIDPYTNQDEGYYLVYYKKNYQREAGNLMHCELNGTNIEPTDNTEPQLRQFGSNKRTFRLALACTRQYATAVAGSNPSKADVLSAMVTTMNRVNGVYEREVATTMVLIGNNDTLIYTTAATDPYTGNNNPGLLLSQNQNNISTVIGSANYDIGHIFSTGGGGVAGLGVVCYNNSKARGVTGSANPVGDPFDVDYVCHEMGHQYHAEHTFNANSGSCMNNGNETTAYEPGGGTTVLGYAGICGTVNNVEQNSDAYFHAISLREIGIFLEDEATCAVVAANDASLPTVADVTAQYSIPVVSYFELEAPLATAASSDTLSYNWEQWNIGNFQSNENLSANFTTGPQFRSFWATESRWRVFPKIEYVVNNSLGYKGERLPRVARTLRFKLTVRNIYNGWGTNNISDNNVVINVVNTGDTFRVISPNATSDSGLTQAPIEVTWNVGATNVAPVNATSVNIYLSVDGGFTYPYTLGTNLPNTGTASVTLPDTVTDKARIKVKGADNVFFDISNANFRILQNPNPPVSIVESVNELANAVSVYPNPANAFINIKSSTSSSLKVALINTLGRKIWQSDMKQTLQIPLKNIAKGLYYLTITDVVSGNQTTKKVIVE